MELILNPSYTGDQGIRVTSLALEPLFIVQSILNKFAWLTAACKFELSECNAALKTSRTKRKFTTNRYVTKHSNRDLLELPE